MIKIYTYLNCDHYISFEHLILCIQIMELKNEQQLTGLRVIFMYITIGLICWSTLHQCMKVENEIEMGMRLNLHQMMEYELPFYKQGENIPY